MRGQEEKMKQLLNPALTNMNYAFFVSTEGEAVKNLNEAFKMIYSDNPEVIGFVQEDSEEENEAEVDSLIFMTKEEIEEDEGEGFTFFSGRRAQNKAGLGKPKVYNEEKDYDDTIKLSPYGDESLLSIQIADTDNIPINNNVMLVKFLEEMCSKR